MINEAFVNGTFQRHVNLTLERIHSTGRRSSIVHSINVGRLLRTLTARFGSVRCRFGRSSHSTASVVPSAGTFMESLAQCVGGFGGICRAFSLEKGSRHGHLCKVMLVNRYSGQISLTI